MSVVDFTLSFWSKQTDAARMVFGEARSKALQRDLGLDDMIKLWNEFSFGTLDRWLWASPWACGEQSKFATHPSSKDVLGGVTFSAPPIPPNTKPSAALIVLRSKNGSGKPACDVQPTGHVSISATDLKDWAEGDAFLIIGYIEDKMTSEQIALAKLLVSVTA